MKVNMNDGDCATCGEPLDCDDIMCMACQMEEEIEEGEGQ